MGQRKNPTPKPDLQPTGHPVSGQAPHLAARPGEAAKRGILMDVITHVFMSKDGCASVILYGMQTNSKATHATDT